MRIRHSTNQVERKWRCKVGAAVVDGEWAKQVLQELEKELAKAGGPSQAVRLMELLRQEVVLGAEDVRTGKVRLVGEMTVPLS